MISSVIITQPNGSGQTNGSGSGGNNTTPAIPAARVLRLAFIADTGARAQGLTGGAASPLADLIARWNPDKILLGGDCRYSPTTYTVATSFLAGRLADTIACPGNHDLDEDNGAAFHDFFPHPAYASGLPGCYRVTLGHNLVDIFVINDGLKTNGAQTLEGGNGQGSPLSQWFAAECLTANAPHRLVLVHHPIFSPASSGANETIPGLAWLTDPRYAVNAILNGHTHLSAVSHQRGVLCLNASATARVDGSLDRELHGETTDAFLEWAETETSAACLITVTPTGLRYEFVDADGNVRHAGSPEARVNVQILETDVIGPNVALANGAHYVSHSSGAYYLDAVRFALCSPPRGQDAAANNVRIELRLDNVTILEGTLKSGTIRVPTSATQCRRLILPGQRLTVHVRNAPTSYAHPSPPKGLRLSQIIRLVAA